MNDLLLKRVFAFILSILIMGMLIGLIIFIFMLTLKQATENLTGLSLVNVFIGIIASQLPGIISKAINGENKTKQTIKTYDYYKNRKDK